jgi:hypothetical protein
MPLPDFDESTILAADSIADSDENDVPGCTMVTQELTEWCWAAVAQTFEALRGTTVEQCQIAVSVLGLGCCGDDKPSCNVERKFPEVCQARSIPCKPVGGILEFSDIKAEIDQGRPVCCFIQSSIGHVILISGYAPGEQLHILDPGFDEPMPPREQSYASFRVLYGDDGHWLNTYRFI